MDITGQMLQGGSVPQGGQPQLQGTQLPSLGDHANTMMQLGMQQPVGSPERQNMLLSGLQLGQAHAQTLPQPDAFMVQAPDGQSYAFPTAEAAGQFKQRIASQTTGNLGDLAQGVVGGVIKGTSGFQQILNNITGQGNQPTLGDLTQTPDTGLGRLGTGVGETLPIVAATAATAGAGLAPLGAADIAAGAGLGDVAASTLPMAATNAATAGLGTEGDIGQRTEAALGAGVGTVAGGIAIPYLANAAPAISGMFGNEGGENPALQNLVQGSQKFEDFGDATGQQLEAGAKAITEANPDIKISLDSDLVSQARILADKYNIQLPTALSQEVTIPDNVTGTVEGQSKFIVSPEGDFTPRGTNIGGADITMSDVQNLARQINQQYGPKGLPSALDSFYTDLRDITTNQLNSQQDGLGDEFNKLFETTSGVYKSMAPFKNTFGIDTTTASPAKLQSAIDSFRELGQTDTGQAALKMQLENLKAHGLDLTTEAKAMQYLSTLKKPLVKKAVSLLLKAAGLGFAGDIYKHLP